MSNLTKASRILVVDDELPLGEAIAKRLRRAGHTITTAPDASAALAHCEVGPMPYDLVLTDVHMPGMNGLDLATTLIERRPRQRVVVMTGDPDQALKRDALARGPVSFLPKPFDSNQLMRVVCDALTAQRQMLTPPPAAQRAYREASIGTMPAEWLQWVDERSNAGAGHTDRVARMARIIALNTASPMSAFALAELEVAAWSHEVSLLVGPTANPVDMARRSADILRECGSNELVVRLVRHMQERWEGSGGPDGLRGESIPLGARILSAADSIDHYCAAWLAIGMDAATSAERAIDLVVNQRNTCFDPQIAAIVRAQSEQLTEVCAVERRERVDDSTDVPASDVALN